MSFKKILVAVDFSEYSDKAVEYGMFLAEKYCSDITLLHAIVLFQEDFDEEEQLVMYENLVEKKEQEKAKHLNSKCMKGKEKGIKINSAITRGFSEADSILNYTYEHKFDLLVLGTHGRTGLRKVILGSVAEKVIRKSPIPVLTIHNDFSKMTIKKILVPIDFTKYSQLTIKEGKRLANEFNAQIDFVHIVENKNHPEFYAISSEPILKANPGLEDHILKNMQKLTGLPNDQANYAAVEGKVYKEIKNYIDKNQIDLVVMGTNTIHEIDEILLGSNSERVARMVTCPVLTVKRN